MTDLKKMRVHREQPTPEQIQGFAASFAADCKRAADCIRSSDILILNTGAGFSADSGLAVYKDIANVEHYKKRNLDYASISVPGWFDSDKPLAYGFWGKCMNDYRTVKPNASYRIIAEWRDKYFNPNTPAAKKLQEILGNLDADAKTYSFAPKPATAAAEKPSTPPAAAPSLVSRLFGCAVTRQDSDDKPPAAADTAPATAATATTTAGTAASAPAKADAKSAPAPLAAASAAPATAASAAPVIDAKSAPASTTAAAVSTTTAAGNAGSTIAAFYSFTSNVDAHLVNSGYGYRSDALFECHGNIEKWQCTARCRGSGTWALPPEFRFKTDDEWNAHKLASHVPRLGAEWTAAYSCESNQPYCKCGLGARPWILMFGDWAWAGNTDSSDRYQRFLSAIKKLVKTEAPPPPPPRAITPPPAAIAATATAAAAPAESADSKLKGAEPAPATASAASAARSVTGTRVVILEIGAGLNVPTVRHESEDLLVALPESHVTLIRINADFPLCKLLSFRHGAGERVPTNVISIMSKGVDAITEINKYL